MDGKTSILEWFRERIGRDPCPAHVAEFEARPLTLAEAHALPTATIKAAFSSTAASIIEEIKRCSPSLAGRQAQPPAWVVAFQPAVLDEAVEAIATGRRGPRLAHEVVEAAGRALLGKASGGPPVPDDVIERIARGAASSGPSDDAVAEAAEQVNGQSRDASPSGKALDNIVRDLGA